MTGNADDTTSLRDGGSPALARDDLQLIRTRSAQLTALLGLLLTVDTENSTLELAYELALDIHCAAKAAE